MKCFISIFTFFITLFASNANSVIYINEAQNQNFEMNYIKEGVLFRANPILYLGVSSSGNTSNIFTTNPEIRNTDFLGHTFTNNSLSQTNTIKRFYEFTIPHVDFSNAVEVAGFQIAIWEMFDNWNMNTGKYYGWIAYPQDYVAVDVIFSSMVYLRDFMESENLNSINTSVLSSGYWETSLQGGIISDTSNSVPESDSFSLFWISVFCFFLNYKIRSIW